MKLRLLQELAFFVGGEDGRDVEYVPFVSERDAGWHVGYRVTKVATGQVTYVYLNATDHGVDYPEACANVFVYEGPEGDPNQDTPHHHYDIDFPEPANAST